MKANGLIRRSITTVLACLILLSAAVPAGAASYKRVKKDSDSSVGQSQDEERRQEDSREWEDNLIIEKPLDLMGKKEKFVSVTFLDTVEDVPKKPWHLGQLGARKNVLGWVEWEYGEGHVYIAAEGGINGRDACTELFMDCENLEEVNFNGAFHTDDVESMVNMFYNCYDLEKVDLETLNTSSVTSMYQMFRSCVSLEKLDLSEMDTSEVETMYCMFSTCSSLEELGMRSFDTRNVTNMGYMFSACKELKRVDVTSFDTSKVTYMAGMFRWCNELEEYDFNGWDVSNVTGYSGFMNDGMKINGKPWEQFFE